MSKSEAWLSVEDIEALEHLKDRSKSVEFSARACIGIELLKHPAQIEPLKDLDDVTPENIENIHGLKTLALEAADPWGNGAYEDADGLLSRVSRTIASFEFLKRERDFVSDADVASFVMDLRDLFPCDDAWAELIEAAEQYQKLLVTGEFEERTCGALHSLANGLEIQLPVLRDRWVQAVGGDLSNQAYTSLDVDAMHHIYMTARHIQASLKERDFIPGVHV